MKVIKFIIFLIGLIGLVLNAQARAEESSNMQISSVEFKNNTAIPVKFTCQGKGFNPPLIIQGVPAATKSLALVVDDPDAVGGNFVHWVVFDAPIIEEIKENSVFGKQGLNSLGKLGYVPPCPPSGTHRYIFKLYALDVMLNLNEGTSKEDLETAMQGHILDQSELIGLYKKI